MDQIDNIFLGLSNKSETKRALDIITRNTSFTWATNNTVYMTERGELERTFIPR